MLNRMRLALALLALLLVLPTAALCEGTKEDGKQPKDTPDAAPPKAEQPKTEAPPKAAKVVYKQAPSPAPVPSGMAFIEAGLVRIGTDQAYLDGILEGRPPEHRRIFLYETPYHMVFLRPYFIGRFEVTNAQYLRFLRDSATVYDTAGGGLANLDEIAAYLVRLSKDQQKERHQIVWQQLYFANKEIIWQAFKKNLAKFVVKRADGEVDEIATARKFRFEPLPRTLKLKFYTMRPPTNWPSMTPPPGEEDHPVRFVSYNDVEKFCEWAGLHVPLESEWEWAARGPRGYAFPWGNDWPQNEIYANWGGKIIDSRYMPMTLPVAARDGANPHGKKDEHGRALPIDGDGRSWCGCYQMVGNVAEWTGSWFQRYPTAKATHSFMGHYVKVIRGGAAPDLEKLVLRPACRNYIGAGPEAPPYPENRFKWVGFRTASYMKSGRDQLGPIVRRVTRPKKVKLAHLDQERFIGAITRNWVEPGAEPDNHVYVLGRSHAVVVIPNASFLRDDGLELMRRAWKRPSSYKSARGIKKKSETEHPFWTLGVLHTDIGLEGVQVRKPEEPVEPGDPDAKDGKKKKKKKKGRRRRGRAKAPLTVEGTCPPGTYVLGIWFGRVTIMTPAKEFVCFVPLMEGQKLAYEVTKVKPADAPPATLKVDPELDWADLSFDMPLGGRGTATDVRLAVKTRLSFEVGSLEAAGTWIQEDPARKLTSTLRAAYDEAQAAAKKAPKKPAAKGPKKKDPAK